VEEEFRILAFGFFDFVRIVFEGKTKEAKKKKIKNKKSKSNHEWMSISHPDIMEPRP